MHIGVFGAGAWGTALAIAFSRQHRVTLWSREAREIADLRSDGENRRYLPGIPLPAGLHPSDSLAEAARADLHLVVTPLAGLRATARALHDLAPGTPLLWACKGLEAGTAQLPHQIVADELGGDAPCGVLTGPSFAAEVAKGLPAAVTLAARDLAFARHWVNALHDPRLRLYANDDLVGAEVGGAVKNVMAIAAGVADGMGFGLNARAALITRGLAEITRLGIALGGRRETFMGLAGLGDLVLTCTGDLSRNRRVGLLLAEGKTLPDILATLGHVAEGVSTAREVAALATRLGVDMPITAAVDGVLHGGLGAREAVEQLLARDPKQE
ncbi:MAG TPA: NAD(P)H-dependent glycerol-3-phosphate dehydrogenase [Zoogloea sp.]|uniref:NAD(P)H-dependent glycerol-3-phosphate dehydrogenase n=1 Tax=Zoogloea sp. TaxID=49181 RepID=UPI002B59723D|nr:NAD(P)H-dependent glycerol-3-phosphate dehydrogenase [Zoogloea sp.]HMY48770.1 NAD(P)H-dependent glycerol-3-phosphate dehydrogenase [Rhodocyclaceae bacterium]HNB63826.1 NAD(P)H-dependent glycerol-3-phosphate dehydrogenase [Rhodocyclaceae bacterium]HNC79586.1 NAD(P)H-dependent glycerol-3-phosphate dehydrogenase [Rhodocyclaceae bacterium]HNE15360.1 NAD(P)H-dependent glycerol-3-phosphate dehydrogenase [Rhodocyclaceae bacterium]HNF61099.1 NAD(P)H-dependent glycerol-3-phosphate dehydrogenase [Rho